MFWMAPSGDASTYCCRIPLHEAEMGNNLAPVVNFSRCSAALLPSHLRQSIEWQRAGR
jgi:hypothetical protein